ncbi:MAG: phosphate acyltransferase PlsX [Planctomycetes bacterium]|nr:phosphate acyltransferase PlsX [Planctomycetota bacterium]
MPRIAIDAMGGDKAPGVVVRGAWKVAKEQPDWQMLLVGDEAAISAELGKCESPLPNIHVIHSSEVIGMDEHPVEALKAKKQASLPMAVMLVREGKADAVISAGNTGALVAAGTLMLRTLPGVRRAGILTTLPTLKGRIVIMDVGANVAAKAGHIAQYAAMGDIFYRNLLANESDKVHVSLLSVGGEEGKGSLVIKEAYALLNQSELDFRGNIEGHEVFAGDSEVIVCDGLVGNVVLKTAEGLCEILVRMFAQHATKAGLATDDRLKETLRTMTRDLDWQEVGGAALLGVNGTVVIAHGRSDDRAIASGIRTAADCCNKHVNDKIIEALQVEAGKAGATS